MALLNLPPELIRVPGVAGLNEVLNPLGFGAEVVVVSCDAGMPLGRRPRTISDDRAAQIRREMAGQPDDDIVSALERANAEARKEGERVVRGSCDWLAASFGLPYLTIPMLGSPDTTEIMPILGVGFSSTGDVPMGDLVQVATYPGFMPGETAHGPCLGLVCSSDFIYDVLMVTPFTDAPAGKIVYADIDAKGKPFVVAADIMGLWHRLPHGLVRRTMAELANQVEAKGVTFDITKVWVYISPGASEQFKLEGDRDQRLSSKHRDRFIHTEMVRQADETYAAVNFLNLRGWFHHLFLELGVRPDQIGILNHDTVTSTCYASKRARVGMRQVGHGDVLPSNALILRVYRLTAV